MDRKDYYLTNPANSGVWYYRLRNDRRYRSTGVHRYLSVYTSKSLHYNIPCIKEY